VRRSPWVAPRGGGRRRAAATPGVDAPPLPQPARAIAVPALVEQRLDNGLSLVVTERHDLPLVSALLMVRAGPERDPPSRAGMAELTSALLTKGARRGGSIVPATAIAQQAEALGSTIDAGSAWRASTLAMTVATPMLPDALALLADLWRVPTLAADELDRARKQALDDLRVTMGDPAEVAGLAIRRAWWGASPYGTSATAATLGRITRDDVQRFHAQCYRPEQTVLVLAGDTTPEEALVLATRTLGDWRGSNAAAAPEPSASPPRPAVPPLVRIDMPGSGQSGVIVAAPFVPMGSPERLIGQVANAVLGGGYSARLNQVVRIERGLSYGAWSHTESQPGGGVVLAQTQTRHSAAAEVLALMRDEIVRVADVPPSVDELAARQASLTGSFARRLTTTSGLAGMIVNQIAQERPLGELAQYVDGVMAVTAAQVRDFARRHWTTGALRAVAVGDLKAAGPALDEDRALTLSLATLDLGQPALMAPK
jgi:zinc protease